MHVSSSNLHHPKANSDRAGLGGAVLGAAAPAEPVVDLMRHLEHLNTVRANLQEIDGRLSALEARLLGNSADHQFGLPRPSPSEMFLGVTGEAHLIIEQMVDLQTGINLRLNRISSAVG